MPAFQEGLGTWSRYDSKFQDARTYTSAFIAAIENSLESRNAIDKVDTERIRPVLLYEGRGEFPSIRMRVVGTARGAEGMPLLLPACPACRHARDNRGAGEG